MRFGLFIFTLVLGAILSKYFAYSGSVSLYALLTLPGTFFHELAHYLAAFVMGGRPFGFNLIPNGYIMGSVMFHPNSVNAAFACLAPIILLPLAGLFAALATRGRIALYPMYVYLVACVWEAGTPSRQDILIALQYPTSFLVGVPLLLGLTYVMVKATMLIVHRK